MFVNCITRNRKHPTLRAISVKYETKDKKKRARILWISRYYFYISVKVLKTHQSIRVKKIVLVPFEVKSRNPSEIYDKGYQLFYIYRSQWGIQKYDIISHTIGTQQSKQKAKLLSHTPPTFITVESFSLVSYAHHSLVTVLKDISFHHQTLSHTASN